jgi:hypothetical protein
MAPPRFDFGKDGNDCQAAGEYCSPSRAFVAIGMLSTASRSHQAFNGNDLGIGLGKAARFRPQQTFRRVACLNNFNNSPYELPCCCVGTRKLCVSPMGS